MRKNLFNSTKKLMLLALCLFTFKAQSATQSTAGAPGTMSTASVAKTQAPNTQTKEIWGINSANQIWCTTKIDATNPTATVWQQVDGSLTQIAVGPHGQIWGVNSANQVWYRTGIDATHPTGTSWQGVDGSLTQIAVGPHGQIWGVNSANQVWYRTGIDATHPTGTSWQGVDGSLTQIAVGSNGQICGVNSANQIWNRIGIDATHPTGTAWQQVNGGLTQIAVGPNGQIWGVIANQVWYTTKIDTTNPTATVWQQIDGSLTQIAVGPNGQIIGVNSANQLWNRIGIDATHPTGTGWQQVNGSLICIAIKPSAHALGNLKVGDTVKIESSEKPGYFLADDGAGKSLLTNDLTKNITWVLQRQGATDGTHIDSGTFPKLMNKATGKYLGGTASGTPIPMASDYVSGEFWTPISVESNDPTNINTLLATFRATRYPEQYTYVLYRGMSGDGDGQTFTTPSTADTTKGYTPGYATVGIVPQIDTVVSHNKKIAFVSNGGFILTNTIGYTDSIKDETTTWYIRKEQASDFPDTYTCITPKANLDEITMGCKDGKIELWAIDNTNKVYRFNESVEVAVAQKTDVDPWEAQNLIDKSGKAIPGLDGICATCDGSLFGIRSDDKAAVKYDWTKKQWDSISIENAAKIKLEDIAASKANEIYATSVDGKIYELKQDKLKKETWTQISTGSYIAAGIGTDNKSIVIGIAATGIPYQYTSKKWVQLGKDIQLDKVSIGNQNYILGVNTKDQLVQWNAKTKEWDLVAGKKEKSIESVDEVAAIPSGTTVVLDKFGNTWHKGYEAVTVTAKGVEIIKSTGTTVVKAVASKKVSTAAKKTVVKLVAKKLKKPVAVTPKKVATPTPVAKPVG